MTLGFEAVFGTEGPTASVKREDDSDYFARSKVGRCPWLRFPMKSYGFARGHFFRGVREIQNPLVSDHFCVVGYDSQNTLLGDKWDGAFGWIFP